MKNQDTGRKSNLRNKNRNGRPPLPDQDRQSIVRHTRFSPAEDLLLKSNMAKAGYSHASEYIRCVSLNPRIVPRLTPEESKLARSLSEMDNNFNQFVKLCHQHGFVNMYSEAKRWLGMFENLLSKLNGD